MRSVGLLAATVGALVLAAACSDNGPSPENAAPVANFGAPSCTINAPCDFASTSTDDQEVTAWSWDFDGDGTADATTADATFTYSSAGTFDVSLTVSDAEGLENSKTSSIIIDPVNPTNTAPTAGFTVICDAADCSFTSTSTDEAPGSIAAHAWDFGDGAESDETDPSHSYTVTEPTDFTVMLTVTDNEGSTDVETQTVSVVPVVLENTLPTAGFTFTCTVTTCSFTSTSTDAAPGTIATHAWRFGDGAGADVANPSHTYTVGGPTDFRVRLTVTDNEGAIDADTQTVSLTPPPPVEPGCFTSGTRVECTLDVAARSTIKVRLLGISCDLAGQRITVPLGDQLFLNVCLRAVGDSTRIFGGPGDSAIIFEPGSQVRLRFGQGTAGPGEPTPAAPAAQITGSFPNWTISFEDGANPGGPGEPDFSDVVLGVEAVPTP